MDWRIGLATLALCGCGGGGESQPAAPAVVAVTTFPVESVLTKVATTAGNYGGTFTDATGSYALSISIAPGPDLLFTNASPAPSKTFTSSTILKKNGATISTGFTTFYFTTNPLSVVGERSGTDVVNMAQHVVVPATATVGASGAFFSGTDFIGGSVLNTSAVTGTWSLEQDSANTAFVCLNSRFAAILITTEADCFKVDSTGAIVGFKATTTTNARSTGSTQIIDTFIFQ